MEPGPQFRQRTQSAGQLGLFSAAPHMATNARYPRGYTPDRQRDVMQALRHPTSDSHGNDDPVIKAPYSTHPEPEHSFDKEMNAFHERGVIDAISRSTVPAEHLTERLSGPHKYQENAGRLGHIVTNHRMTDAAGRDTAAYFSEQHLRAQYAEPHETPHDYRSIVMSRQFGSDRGPQGAGPQFSMRRDEEQAQTLIHELGHHDSAADDDWEAHLDRMDYFDHIQGAHPGEEGYADNYADTHYRSDPRLKRKAPFSSGYASMLRHHVQYREERPNPQSMLDAEKLKPRAALRAKPKPPVQGELFAS